jgi:hypothetical protein
MVVDLLVRVAEKYCACTGDEVNEGLTVGREEEVVATGRYAKWQHADSLR